MSIRKNDQIELSECSREVWESFHKCFLFVKTASTHFVFLDVDEDQFVECSVLVDRIHVSYVVIDL